MQVVPNSDLEILAGKFMRLAWLLISVMCPYLQAVPKLQDKVARVSKFMLTAATATLSTAQSALAEATPGTIEIPDEYLRLSLDNPAFLGFTIVMLVWVGPQSVGMLAIDRKIEAARDRCEEYGIDITDCFSGSDGAGSLFYGRLRSKLMEYETRELCAKNDVDVSDITEESEEDIQARINAIRSRLEEAGVSYKFKLEGFL